MNTFFKYLLKVTIVYIVFILLFDSCIYNFFTTHHHRFITDIKHKNYNLLFIGNSRSYNHFNPLVFDSIKKTNSVNLGMPGASVIDVYAGLRIYCCNNKIPKNIIVNIDTFKISLNSQPTIKNIHNFLKYKNHKELSYFYIIPNKYKLLNYPMLQYCISPSWGFREIYKGLIANIHADSRNRGFGNVIKNTNYRERSHQKILIDVNSKYYDSIYNFCIKNKINVTFVFSPMYRSNFDIKFKYNFLNHSQLLDSNIYFSNPNHLNLKGAYIYTNYLAKKF